MNIKHLSLLLICVSTFNHVFCGEIETPTIKEEFQAAPLDLNINIDLKKLNARDENGNTLLIIETRAGNIDKVRELLASGAIIVAQNNEGRTALHYAVINGSLHLIQLLLQHGNKDLIRLVDADGNTALDYAKKLANGILLPLLLEHLRN